MENGRKSESWTSVKQATRSPTGQTNQGELSILHTVQLWLNYQTWHSRAFPNLSCEMSVGCWHLSCANFQLYLLKYFRTTEQHHNTKLLQLTTRCNTLSVKRVILNPSWNDPNCYTYWDKSDVNIWITLKWTWCYWSHVRKHIQALWWSY